MSPAQPSVAVFGASGLIGGAVASALLGEGFRVRAIARRFTSAQGAALGAAALEAPFLDLDAPALAALITRIEADVVVNCVGVLQDQGAANTRDAHHGFPERLLAALGAQRLLIHVSIPGRAEDDRTAFSATKRAAERVIAASAAPHLILRPGFVIAQAAYGGSALIRAFAMLPFAMPAREAGRPFAVTAVDDVAETVAQVTRRWRGGERTWGAAWDVMSDAPSSVGAVIEAFRRHLGGPAPVARLPGVLLSLGANAADLAGRLGWTAPIRSTALAEMRRGVEGEPAAWMAATGIAPTTLEGALALYPPTVQERWFARLYLAKALILASLALFWIVSGAIALGPAFDAATAMLTAHGWPLRPAQAVTALTSLLDMAIGFGIALRRTCRAALAAGVVVSLGYMLGAAIIAPDLWVEPLGALVKTGPAIVLMLVALAILDDR